MWHCCEEPFKAPLFLRVLALIVKHLMQKLRQNLLAVYNNALYNLL